MELKEAIDTRCSVRNYGLCCGSYLKRRRSICLIHWNHIMLMAHSVGLGICRIGFAQIFLNVPGIKKRSPGSIMADLNMKRR